MTSAKPSEIGAGAPFSQPLFSNHGCENDKDALDADTGIKTVWVILGRSSAQSLARGCTGEQRRGT